MNVVVFDGADGFDTLEAWLRRPPRSLAGIEVAHMIRKKQFQSNHTFPFKQFASLAA